MGHRSDPTGRVDDVIANLATQPARPLSTQPAQTKIVIILVTLATAAIHLSFYIACPAGELIYELNALGCVNLVAAQSLPNLGLLANSSRLLRQK